MDKPMIENNKWYIFEFKYTTLFRKKALIFNGPDGPIGLGFDSVHTTHFAFNSMVKASWIKVRLATEQEINTCRLIKIKKS